MEPLLVFAAEFWWIAPATVAAGTAGWLGLRSSRTKGPRAVKPMPRGAARRLGVDAALHELESAKSDVARSRAQLRVAQADLLRVEADRAASHAPDGAVAAARRRVQSARSELKAAGIAVRARRAAVGAARATVPAGQADRAEYPLGRLMAEHDALTARWMQYETDPAMLIAYPAMSDSRSPLLAAFLDAERNARWLRPASIDARVKPADFAAYRVAVRHAEDAFDAAERDALIKAGHRPPPPQWTATAESWFERAQDVLTATQRTVEWSIKNFPRRDQRPPSS
ncbi:hypothetical protein GCM10009775_11890 [Microbacterium aoyamense]|uniref:Uncharacterized protein n=1 Tax=Microbacterium aoyamense TaxID=344166 RepID=A0ABP5AV58_9MICO|nr:hypothetical protein [Microbacterium aoyamense]